MAESSDGEIDGLPLGIDEQEHRDIVKTSNAIENFFICRFRK